jgi:hypothetical protein
MKVLDRVTTLSGHTSMREPQGSSIRVCAMVLVAVAIVSSAFHFWPFEHSKTWQILSPSNLSALAWGLLIAGYLLLKRRARIDFFLLPHLSVFAYLTVNALSIAFAPDLSRAVTFTVKLALMLVCGYLLFSSAVYSARTLRMVYGLATVACLISVSYCIAIRFGFGSNRFGFHGDVYKYGTYIGTLAPLCATYLLTSSRTWVILLGAALVGGALVSSGSLGAVAAVIVGMTSSAIVFGMRTFKLPMIAAVLGGIGLGVFWGWSPAMVVLQNDVKLVEKDGVNLKQRYIEWQAEVSLLEERSITGTGAGCINEYRSSYYYRLPKLNTLGLFDQNGWLATAAETGLLGLVCFCWIVAHYVRLAFFVLKAPCHGASATVRRFAAVNFAGLIGASTANSFSSVQYNGVLIVFVLVLVLIARTNWIFGELGYANCQSN